MSLKDGKSATPAVYMGSCADYGNSRVVIVGAPMDNTCSFRPGARFGPGKIREVSNSIEEYSLYQNKDLLDCVYCDCGDLDIIFGNVQESLDIIGSAACEVLKDGKIPLFIGGEHLISVPVIRSAYEKYGDELVVVQFDAHADLREEYKGCSYSHASAMRRLVDFMPGRNIYQFGIRSGTREEFEYARTHTNMFTFKVQEPLQMALEIIGRRPVYVTVDIDVLDPAYAGGTGTPEPGGITSDEILKSVLLLGGLNLAGFDVVEVSPVYDHSDMTAVLSAKIIREMILMAAFSHQ